MVTQGGETFFFLKHSSSEGKNTQNFGKVNYVNLNYKAHFVIGGAATSVGVKLCSSVDNRLCVLIYSDFQACVYNVCCL